MKTKTATPIESSRKNSKNKSKPKALGKLDSMLLRFAQGKKYHRFSAEIVGDHCLPTTISCLQRMYGLYFSRKLIKVPNRFGSESTVALYWLEGKDLVKAREISGLEARAA